MKTYIDLFIIFNTIIDFIIILGVSILLKRKTNYFRIILSSILGGLSSFVLFTSINKILVEVISAIIMVVISFGFRNIKYVIKNLLYMYLLSTLIGGIIYLFNIKVTSSIILSYLIIIIIAIEVVFLYIKENKKIKNIYNNYYKVDIYFKDNNKLSLVGFMDTGNNLYDPYKHRPIIIITNKYIISDKYLLVPYNTVSGEDILKCIKPDKIYIEGIGYKTNFLVGISKSIKLIDGVDVILHRDLLKG